MPASRHLTATQLSSYISPLISARVTHVLDSHNLSLSSIMTNTNLTRFLGYLLLLCIPHALAESDLTITLQQCEGSTDAFTLDAVSMTCDDGICSGGSDTTINGTFTIGDSLYTSSPLVTVTLWQFSSAVYNGTVDICGGTVESSDGYYCPDAATYSFITGSAIPWYASIITWLNISVWVTFDFGGDQEVVCQLIVEGQEDSSSSSSYMIAGSAILFVGIAAFGMRKRRRIVTEGELLEDGPATRFIEMNSAMV